MKKPLFTVALLSSLLLVACGNETDTEVPTLNTDNIDSARENSEQREEEIASNNRNSESETGITSIEESEEEKSERTSDARVENPDLDKPELTDEEKRNAEEYDLPEEVDNFLENTDATVLQNMNYHGYDADMYTSNKDKIYDRYVTGKQDGDKVEGEECDTVVKFFTENANALAEAPDIGTYNRPGPDQTVYIEELADKNFNGETGYLDFLGLMMKEYGSPEIVGVTKDFADPGLYQVQYRFTDENGTPMADGISYYFEDVQGNEQLQVQRMEYTAFGAYQTSQNIEQALSGGGE